MTESIKSFIAEHLSFDMDGEVNRIGDFIRAALRNRLRKRGLVVAISGGIDSAVCCALAVKAVGSARVHGLLLPEQDSASESTERGRELAEQQGIQYSLQNIAATLDSIGCYQWRDEAIRKAFPRYGHDWKNKIVIKGGSDGTFNHFNLVVQDPKGEVFERRLELSEYLTIVAATNFKQRIRKTLEFFHADRLNYAVVGTPNRVEYDQGFFVKNGDGSADIKPIAHLYKTQVYALARHLGLPASICNARPTTDTYSLSQGQDEFYYGLDYEAMDVALWCYNHGKPVELLAEILNVSPVQAQAVYRDIESKRRTTAPLHWPALTIETIDGPQTLPL